MAYESLFGLVYKVSEDLLNSAVEAQPYLNYMYKNKALVVAGYKGVQVPVISGNTGTVGYIDEYHTFTDTDTDSFEIAQYDLPRIAGYIKIDELSKDLYEESDAPTRLAAACKKVLVDEIGAKLEEELTYGDYNASHIFSLKAAAENNHNIGGIDQATNAFWRWQTVDNGGANISLDDINECITLIRKADSKFTCAVTNIDTFTWIVGQVTDAITFNTSTGKLIDIGGGYRHLYIPYAGGVIIGTPAFTDNVMFFCGSGISLALWEKTKNKFGFFERPVGLTSYSVLAGYVMLNQVYARMNDNVKLHNYNIP